MSILSFYDFVHSWSLWFFSGWVCFRTDTSSRNRAAKLQEAVNYLNEARSLDEQNSRTLYYLGRCHSEGQNPHDAFVNYRHAIDKNEHDADTWCSIGVLYQLQNQDTDALQAFICAIQLSQTHNQAWACLGKLYENHFQYKEALYCYKKAVHHKSCKCFLKFFNVMQYWNKGM